MISRRHLMAMLAGALAARPLTLHAQQPARPTIGFLSSISPPGSAGTMAALDATLREGGYIDGQTFESEYRWAEGQYDRLPAWAAEMARRRVALIFAAGLPAALAAKAATSTIPIVFVSGADPVMLGLVASMNQPGGNLTGVTQFFGALGAKRMEILHELVPSADGVGVLINSRNPNTDTHLSEIQAAAQTISRQIYVVDAGSDHELEIAFASLRERKTGALMVADDPFFTTRRDSLIGHTGRLAIPAMFYVREFAASGGLVSYGPNTADNFRQAGLYIIRILKGEKPANLPVLQPTKFELVVNLKTAKTLGLAVPPSLLARADEVIE